MKGIHQSCHFFQAHPYIKNGIHCWEIPPVPVVPLSEIPGFAYNACTGVTHNATLLICRHVSKQNQLEPGHGLSCQQNKKAAGNDSSLFYRREFELDTCFEIRYPDKTLCFLYDTASRVWVGCIFQMCYLFLSFILTALFSRFTSSSFRQIDHEIFFCIFMSFFISHRTLISLHQCGKSAWICPPDADHSRLIYLLVFRNRKTQMAACKCSRE